MTDRRPPATKEAVEALVEAAEKLRPYIEKERAEPKPNPSADAFKEKLRKILEGSPVEFDGEIDGVE